MNERNYLKNCRDQRFSVFWLEETLKLKALIFGCCVKTWGLSQLLVIAPIIAGFYQLLSFSRVKNFHLIFVRFSDTFHLLWYLLVTVFVNSSSCFLLINLCLYLTDFEHLVRKTVKITNTQTKLVENKGLKMDWYSKEEAVDFSCCESGRAAILGLFDMFPFFPENIKNPKMMREKMRKFFPKKTRLLLKNSKANPLGLENLFS